MDVTDDMTAYGARPVLFVASSEDVYSYTSSQTLAGLATGDKQLQFYENAGHALAMFEAEAGLSGLIIEWLAPRL